MTGRPRAPVHFVCTSARGIFNVRSHRSSICLNVLEHVPCVFFPRVLAVPSVRIMYAARVHVLSDPPAPLRAQALPLKRLLTRIHVKGECRRVWLWCVRIGLLIWRCAWRKSCSAGSQGNVYYIRVICPLTFLLTLL